MKSSFFKTFFSCCCFFLLTATLIANTDPTIEGNTLNPQKTIFKTLSTTDILTITISTALDSFILNKKKDRYFRAHLSYMGPDGKMKNSNIKIKPRGRSRRNACDFPPLKLKFSKKELATQGIREAHKTLKLVTHCSEDADAIQNVLEEYLAYKIYNELTGNSLKVQLVKVNYEDTQSETSLNRYGILIEDIDELAERLVGEEVEGFGNEIKDFDRELMNIFAMFQYMIGNEDWRLAFQRNVKFIKSNKMDKLIPIPYDFDASGLVNASYAKPDRDLQLKAVTQRAFMGYFKHKEERAKTVALFNDKKEVIYQTITKNTTLNKEAIKSILTYFNGFYEIINSPKLLKKAIPLKGRKSEPTSESGKYN